MTRTLSDDDIDAIASRVVEMLSRRLANPPQPPPPPQQPAPTPTLAPKLAYTLKELSAELGISRVSLYRFEVRGLLKPLPYFRHKVFSREEVERFLSGHGGDPRPEPKTRNRRH